MLSAGNPFPNFSLPNQDGKTVKLSDYAGQWLVIYFYPKDDTPGCTIQGKSFTATKAEFDASGVKVLGVSADDVASHKNFCHKFAFTVELLSDTNSTLMKALGLGRSTFIVDPKGIIRKVYEKVNPEGHENVLLEDIKGLKSKAA